MVGTYMSLILFICDRIQMLQIVYDIKIFIFMINYFCFFLSCWFYKYYYNNIYNKFADISYVSVTKYLDKGFFEYLGPYGLYKIFHSFIDI